MYGERKIYISVWNSLKLRVNDVWGKENIYLGLESFEAEGERCMKKGLESFEAEGERCMKKG